MRTHENKSEKIDSFVQTIDSSNFLFDSAENLHLEPNDYQIYNSKSGPTVLNQDVMDDESTVEINTVPLHSSTPLRNVALETEIVHEVTDSRSDLESLDTVLQLTRLPHFMVVQHKTVHI